MKKEVFTSYFDFDDFAAGGTAFGHQFNVKNNNKITDWHIQQKLIRAHSQICPYCKSAIQTIDLTNEYTYEEDGHCTIYLCLNCSFWIAYQGMHDFQSAVGYTAFAIQKKFPIDSKDIPISLVNNILKKAPDKMHQLHYTSFEKYMADLLKVEFTDCEVIHMGKPSDGGIDLLLIISSNEKILVQCKRRKKLGAVEGVETVRSLLGTLLSQDELRGIVISTADYFSYHACKLVEIENLKKYGYEIELFDKGKLRELISESKVMNPWHSYFVENLRETGLGRPHLYDNK